MNRSHGFTIVEALIAIFILLSVGAGPVVLITRSLGSAPLIRNELIAHHLAQEGVELFRAIRDNNILCQEELGGSVAWNRDPVPAGGPSTLRAYYEIDALDTAALPGVCNGIITPEPFNKTAATCDRQLLVTDEGKYTYTDTTGTASGFSRCVRVCSPPNINNNATCDGANDGGIPANQQMEIISVVSWEEGAKSVTHRTRLYNWQ
jgi:type II secretory pathway pseudopilin PulG